MSPLFQTGIMDPGMNGREAYERVIQVRPGQKAVIASGFSLTEDVQVAQGREGYATG